MFCGNCGVSITADQKFCRVCGTRLLAISAGTDQFFSRDTGASNKCMLALEVVINALVRGFRYLSATETGGLESTNPRARQMRWGFLFFWAGIAAGFLGRDLGIASFIVGILLMFYARMGEANRAQPIRHEPLSIGTQGKTAGQSWPNIQTGPQRQQLPRQPPFPGQFAETSTVKLTETEASPLPEPK